MSNHFKGNDRGFQKLDMIKSLTNNWKDKPNTHDTITHNKQHCNQG